MSKFKSILKEPRVLIALAFIILALVSIGYNFNTDGVTINSVDMNSSSYNAGIKSPSPDLSINSREKITSINDQIIKNINDYTKILENIPFNSTIRIQTNKAVYVFFKDSSNIGLSVSNVPSTNLRKGLDLQGGTRVVLKPSEQVTNSQLTDIVSIMESRLNTFGLSDLVIRPASDLQGNKFIIVEISGVTKDEIKNIVASQGKFEARIGNDTVFYGSDVTFVCRSGGGANCVDNVNPVCPNTGNGFSCKFEFEIALNQEAAERHSKITQALSIIPSTSGSRILSQNIDFYLDGKQVDSLQIDASLKGIKASKVIISGPGNGASQQDAVKDAIANKKKLETFLITGSLPTTLQIEQMDTVSPIVGEAFVNNALLIGVLAALLVSLVIYVRYRSLKVSIPIIFTLLSEILLILGFAALTKQSLDIASIAGIIASVGTGVNDQIVITDEVLKGKDFSIKQNIKKAFFVILAAYATTVVAMLPLLRAGAGLLRGFAIVTIVGVTIGVFVTRPAFGAVLRKLMENNQ